MLQLSSRHCGCCSSYGNSCFCRCGRKSAVVSIAVVVVIIVVVVVVVVVEIRVVFVVVQCVSKKTSPTFLAITRESIVEFS